MNTIDMTVPELKKECKLLNIKVTNSDGRPKLKQELINSLKNSQSGGRKRRSRKASKRRGSRKTSKRCSSCGKSPANCRCSKKSSKRRSRKTSKRRSRHGSKKKSTRRRRSRKQTGGTQVMKDGITNWMYSGPKYTTTIVKPAMQPAPDSNPAFAHLLNGFMRDLQTGSYHPNVTNVLFDMMIKSAIFTLKIAIPTVDTTLEHKIDIFTEMTWSDLFLDKTYLQAGLNDPLVTSFHNNIDSFTYAVDTNINSIMANKNNTELIKKLNISMFNFFVEIYKFLNANHLNSNILRTINTTYDPSIPRSDLNIETEDLSMPYNQDSLQLESESSANLTHQPYHLTTLIQLTNPGGAWISAS